MSKENVKRKNARDRQKRFEQKRRESREISKNPDVNTLAKRSPTDVRKWPIVRAYVPIEDVFRATGFGSAGIVRAQPDGKLRYSFFSISVRDDGIQSMFGKDDNTQQEIDDLLEELGDGIPPYETGSPELASRYIWRWERLGLDFGYSFGDEGVEYLRLVPLLPGKRGWWLQQFTGPQGLVDPKLMDFIDKNPVPDGIPEDKEVITWTTATFACSNTRAIRDELARRDPKFIDNGDHDDGATFFGWTRAYPKNHWSPLSTLGGRQSLGSVLVYPDRIVADSKVLSTASILFGKLKRAFGDMIHLTDTKWLSTDDDMVRMRDEESDQDEDDE